jgi:hypothetical protein
MYSAIYYSCQLGCACAGSGEKNGAVQPNTCISTRLQFASDHRAGSFIAYCCQSSLLLTVVNRVD